MGLSRGRQGNSSPFSLSTCLDPRQDPGLPGPHVLEKKESEPRQDLCSEAVGTSGNPNFSPHCWKEDPDFPEVSGPRPASELQGGMSLPLDVDGGCGSPSDWGLPEARLSPSNRSSFLTPNEESAESPSLGKSWHREKPLLQLVEGQDTGMGGSAQTGLSPQEFSCLPLLPYPQKQS